MLYKIIAKRLKDTMGLDPESIGSFVIEKAIDRRIAETRAGNIEKYNVLLNASEHEMTALIESVVVPETWFFRDSRPFDYFKKFVAEVWLPNQKNYDAVIRVLSIPCSRGEEPYSIAMSLNDMLPISRISIDAIDISNEALNIARNAVYSENSFRGDEINYRYKYFTKRDNVYELDKGISEMVNFNQGNILDECSPLNGVYDVIFCRNLLIYFDQDDQKRAINILHSHLVQNGVLFVGHAEPSRIFNGIFDPVQSGGVFAYTKTDPSSAKQVVKERHDKSNRKWKIPQKRFVYDRVNQGLANNPAKEKHARKQLTDEDVLKKMRMMADKGELKEAGKLCEEYLIEHSQSAEAYFMLGIVNEAAGNHERAIDSFRKTIYLDENHYEALVHLSLLAERNGDQSAGERYKRRAQRVQSRTKD